jgi:uncharacterized membrane protein
MNLSRRAIQAIAFGVVGLVLLVYGLATYELGIAASEQAARNCGDTACVSMFPSPLFLILAFVGVVLLVVAGLLGLRLAWVSRSRPQNLA